MKNRVGQLLVCAVVVLCLTSSLSGVTAAQSDSDQRLSEGAASGLAPVEPTDAGAELSLIQDNDTSGNDTSDNETKRHENPSSYEEESDLTQVESWLVGRMTDQLNGSVFQLSQGEYDLAREFVGENYRERFSQYVNVTGETETESIAETLNESRETQTQLTDSLQSYEEQKEEYESARDAGDTDRARELARDLDSQAAEIESATERLRERYSELDEQTGEDLTDVIEALEELDEETQSEIADIRSAEFVETTLTVETDQNTISYLNPLSATGTLSTDGAEPLSNETVQIEVAGRTRQVETDSAGMFRFQYRPTTLPLSTTSLPVQYIPAEDSVYLGSNATVGVSVDQVDPEIELQDVPATIGFGESAGVTGTVRVADLAVDGVPVNISVGARQLGTARVQNGSFTDTISLPASVPDGQQELVVQIPGENRALSDASVAQTVTVEATNTTLTVETTQGEESELQLTGTLETVEGTGVGGQPLQVTADGTLVTTVTTVTAGEFAATVPTQDLPSRQVQIRVLYRGTGSNLNPTAADTTVTLGGSGSNTATESIGDNWVGVAVGGLLAACVVIAVLSYSTAGPVRRTPVLGGFIRPLGGVLLEPIDGQSATETETETDPEQATNRQTTENLLRHATEQLQSGNPERAVQNCYAAVRQHIESRLTTQRAYTHWEFYEQYRNAQAEGSSAESATDGFQELTEQYERATFSPTTVSASTAERLVEQAHELCEIDHSDTVETAANADD